MKLVNCKKNGQNVLGVLTERGVVEICSREGVPASMMEALRMGRADAVAALSPDGSTMRIMAYAFTNDLFATGTTRIGISVVPPPAWKGRTGRVTRCVVDDNANWFDEWRAERKRLNIGDDRFFWSPDDPSPASSCGLSSAKDRAAQN